MTGKSTWVWVGLVAVAVGATASCHTTADPKSQGGAETFYEPTWESLSQHRTPEWFRDAKFGIYTHWGPITVASESEEAQGGVQWYGMNMYREDDPAFEYHRKRFGNQNSFGYKDVIPLFEAERFDAEAWATLFEKAGAQFAGPVAIHHDNFAMWDSDVTRWNSANMGPRADVTDQLEKAIKQRGMKFMTAFHHAFTWGYYQPAYAYDAGNPQWSGLYGEPHESGEPMSDRFLKRWMGMIQEVVTTYEPDMLWFDFGLGGDREGFRSVPTSWQQKMFAFYYNWGTSHGKQVAVAHKHKDIHEHTGVLDFERGRSDKLTSYVWLTDTSIGPWFNEEPGEYKSTNELVDLLVDIVSKNGVMLLNVGPKADGTIPKEAGRLLLDIGNWLEINGEAIYGTNPWEVYGEGPASFEGGAFGEQKQDVNYGANDVRFTKKGEKLYAISLGWPGEEITIASLSTLDEQSVASVRMLGSDQELNWSLSENGLAVETPSERPTNHAYVFEITRN